MKKTVVIILAMAIMVLAGLGAWYATNSRTTNPGTLDPISIGGPPLEQSAFIYIAQDQGFFTQYGLNVTIRDDYPNGVVPLNDMIDGNLDVSVSAEYPVVSQAFKNQNISIIGSIDKYQNEAIIGRKDHGIANVSDLKGKKIGVPRGTICEFILGRFLNLNGMSLRDVTLVNVPVSEAVDSIANGDVDAIIYYQPYVYGIENRLGDKGVAWPVQSNQLMYGVIVSRDDWIAGHPGQLNRFLRSLAQAEDYAVAHPVGAKAIVQKRLNFTDAYMSTVWQDHQFSLSLDQSLLIAMNDEGRWMIYNKITNEKTLPDYSNYIYTKGLEEVKPNAVNIR